jgi:hypothetical protein
LNSELAPLPLLPAGITRIMVDVVRGTGALCAVFRSRWAWIAIAIAITFPVLIPAFSKSKAIPESRARNQDRPTGSLVLE